MAAQVFATLRDRIQRTALYRIGSGGSPLLKIMQTGDIQPPHLQYPIAFDHQNPEHANQKRSNAESYPIVVDLHKRKVPLSNRFEQARGVVMAETH